LKCLTVGTKPYITLDALHTVCFTLQILATNIAETSLTIDDVVHVVDCGKVKEKSFDAFSNISMLRCNWISRASSAQRAGRWCFVYHMILELESSWFTVYILQHYYHSNI